MLYRTWPSLEGTQWKAYIARNMLNMPRVLTCKSTRSTTTFLSPLPPPHTDTPKNKQNKQKKCCAVLWFFKEPLVFSIFKESSILGSFQKLWMKEPTSFGYFKKKSETKNWQSSWENEPLVLSISMSFEIFCQVSSRSGYHENFILWVGSLGVVFHNLTSVDYMWIYIYIWEFLIHTFFD